ncbi:MULTISPECIES: sensor domain-containing diguanylate cyclase [unclassified Methylophaga]|uniref:sensor domain-containing diguanylate cyclase n=2 Tax=Methylophaga TaxID=40222 RepID=UPI000C88F89F|nr:MULTISPECIES: sensor domain-containing diguanylate cyclase [unclassified Methylophaga]MAK67217.1 diguanylate cyclase [Methylophaga sp.]MAK68212.1 diguanylate cyclase [Methylophaga sp.]MAY18255.1 diguanylate cyclase [Methylophaga sp.]HCD06204.1 diguanylate cyclase [Methylophaga sp.]
MGNTIEDQHHPAIMIEGIQPFGCLIRFDGDLLEILQVSENLQQILGVSIEAALASSPRDILGGKLQQRLQQTLAKNSRLSAALIINRQVSGSYQRFYVVAYRSDDSIVVEFESLSRSGEQRLMPIVNEWLTRLAQVQEIGQLQQMLVQSVQAVTGYDRVLLCQFDTHWQRTAIAEECRDPDKSLMNFRFPASDIPLEVRARYTVNPMRSIADVDAEIVGLIPASNEIDLPVVDLTPGILRALSAYHQQYLRSINVKASLSIAIAGEQQLWGILTCHDFTPSEISPAERDAAFNLVQMASQRMFLLQARQQAMFLKNVLNSRELLSAERDKVIQPTTLLDKYGKDWMQLFNCTGIALLYRNQVRCVGETLDDYELDIVGKWLTEHVGQKMCWACDQLSKSPLNNLVNVRNRAGLLAVPLPIEQNQSGWFLLFRRAQKAQHNWVGKKQIIEAETPNPLKRIEERGHEIWMETIEDEANRWSVNEQHAAQDLAEDLAVAITVHQVNRLNTQLQLANKQLKEIAHTDTLTKTWNRYRMELAIDAELAAAERYDHPCSVLLFDIDRFKSVNDNYGHDAGDQVLTRLAEEVQSKLRTSDYLGRWGGEEFIVLASHNALDEAMALAERLRKHIESVQFDTAGIITVSIGVAQAIPGNESRKQLLERADQAMYRAKQSGRNRVESASAELSGS